LERDDRLRDEKKKEERLFFGFTKNNKRDSVEKCREENENFPKFIKNS